MTAAGMFAETASEPPTTLDALALTVRHRVLGTMRGRVFRRCWLLPSLPKQGCVAIGRLPSTLYLTVREEGRGQAQEQ